MKRITGLMVRLILLAALPMLTACQTSRYGANRLADFMDIFQLGAGVTSENPITGPMPPSLGLHVQVTEFINLGAVTFHGLTAEIDGRGTFVGPESRTRFGFGPYQAVQIFQDYDNGSPNYFKEEQGLWTKRMNSKKMRWWSKPAKELEYNYWSKHLHQGMPIMHRGWQYWENINIELSLSEPFLTHLGFNLKLGFDASEIFDFLLGWTTIDFKGDDLNNEEYDEMLRGVERTKTETEKATSEMTNEPSHPGDNMERPPINSLRPAPYMDVVYFDFDKSDIRPDQQPRVEKNAAYLNAHPEVRIMIEGNCDERGTTEYNYALGERRAQAVLNYYVSKGINAARLKTVSKGEENPVDRGHSEDAWAKNRRDEHYEWN